MNYVTEKIREEIEKKEYRRQKAVFLAQRIHKANRSPGFDWDKAVAGFADQFVIEGKRVILKDRRDHPEHDLMKISWIDLIVYFADQPYTRTAKPYKGEKHER